MIVGVIFDSERNNMDKAASQHLQQLQQSIAALSVSEKLWILEQIVQQLRTAVPITPTDLDRSEAESEAETDYLLRSPENAQRLLASIAQLEAGQGVEQELIG